MSDPRIPPADQSEDRALRAEGSLGYVHSEENASAVDGPGLRYVVWLMGCHLRCQYCHNPDTWRLPPSGARSTADEVLRRVEKYKPFLATAGGGFTVSGGEPLVQAPFALQLLRGAKRLGLHTALDTNGYLGDSLSDGELAEIDLVLLDLKAFDAHQHRQVTGAGNEPILNFAKRLADLGRPAWVRYVLAPGLTDGTDDIARLAEFVATLANVERVEVLPFHQMGRNKWAELGLDYPLANTAAATTDEADRARDLFRRSGCAVA
ncbi:MAG: pyruvate formate-lyase-activating protein [Planctomycetota bacterium]